jgi:ankyrin repeat protein
LWNPYSYVEPLGLEYLEVTEYGIVRVIPVRMNSNLKTMTIEELRENKKSVHVSCLQIMKRDIKLETSHFACDEDTQNRIYAKWDDLYQEHVKIDAEDYLDPEKYKKLFFDLNRIKQWSVQQMISSEDESRGVIFSGPVKAFGDTVLTIYSPLLNLYMMDTNLTRWHKAVLLDMIAFKGQDYHVNLARRIAIPGCDEDDINAVSGNGDTAVITAVRTGHLLSLIALCESRADVNKTNLETGHSPLRIASDEKNYEAITILRQYGALKENEKLEFLQDDEQLKKALMEDILHDNDHYPENSIWVAAREGHGVRLEHLLKQEGAKICMEKKSIHGENDAFPLWVAACNGQEKCVAVLLKAKADVNQADKSRKTSLYIATEFDHYRCVKLLVENKALVNPFKYKMEEINAEIPVLWIAAFKGSKKSIDNLFQYSDEDIDLDRTGPSCNEANERTTPLHIALKMEMRDQEKWSEVVKSLRGQNEKRIRGRTLMNTNESVGF